MVLESGGWVLSVLNLQKRQYTLHIKALSNLDTGFCIIHITKLIHMLKRVCISIAVWSRPSDIP